MENQYSLNWRDTVTTMTDKVFPGLSNKINENVVGNEVMSNLALQMGLYFNVVFLPIWFLVLVLYLFDQFTCFNELYKFITVAILISVVSIETLRLYLGYEGNLKDKIPELAGFWMLSVLLQFPLQGFLLFNPHFKLRIMEVTIQSIMFLLLGAQILAGYNTLKYTARKQALYVRIMNLHNYVPATIKQNKYK